MARMDITSGGSKDNVRDESVAESGALVRSMRVWAVAVEMIERWREASGGRCIIKSGGGDKEESARWRREGRWLQRGSSTEASNALVGLQCIARVRRKSHPEWWDIKAWA